jgi:sensor histidine kinase YesM
VENALRYLDPEIIAQEPERGLIQIVINTEPKGYLVEVRDRGRGMDTARLREVQSWLVEASNNAGSDSALAFHFGRRSSGQKLGLGLVLTAYFMGMLKDKKGTRGSVSIESQESKGTCVILFFPHNTEQTSIDLRG